MSQEFIKLISALKYLGIKCNIEVFECRKKIQKTVYILKAMGMNYSYNFSLYLYGVYSKELADDYYAHEEELKNQTTDYNLPDDDKKILDKFEDMDNATLEAVSTIIYKDLQYANIKTLLKEIKNIKPRLTDFQIISAQNKAKKLLFKDEYYTAEIKKEIMMWEKVDDSTTF